MASDYGLNFGFRRSDESLRASEGRFRTPAGSSLLVGSCVEIDPATEGYLRVGASDVAARTGVCGLLVQELQWDHSIYETTIDDSYTLGVAEGDRLSVITNGAGVKVWLKNTPAESRADGRQIPAVTIVDLTNVVVGSLLGWDGTVWSLTASDDVTDLVNHHMEVTAVDSGDNYVEATLLK